VSNYYEFHPDLKPCPFCGGQAGIARIGNQHTKKYVAEIGCNSFGCTVTLKVGAPKGHASTEWVDSKAVEKWNKRANVEACIEAGKRLEVNQ
jgi:hypothetical protein